VAVSIIFALGVTISTSIAVVSCALCEKGFRWDVLQNYLKWQQSVASESANRR